MSTRQRLEQLVHKPSVVGATRNWKRQEDASPTASEGAWPYWHLDFEFLLSRTMKEYVYFVLSHPVGGTWLQQPQDTHTAPQLKSQCNSVGSLDPEAQSIPFPMDLSLYLNIFVAKLCFSS